MRGQTIMVGAPAHGWARGPDASLRYAAIPPASPDAGQRWRDPELRRLEALLSRDVIGAGRRGGDLVRALEEMLGADEGTPSVYQFFHQLLTNRKLTMALADSAATAELSGLIEWGKQQRGVTELRNAIDNALTTPAELHALIRRESWVFGGRYIPPAKVDRIAALTELDLPLMRSDGAIHVVVLGSAQVPRLVEPGPAGFGVGPPVHALVNRAMSQLELVERNGEEIHDLLNVESRRALATVVVGHQTYILDKAAQAAAKEVLRVYSSHLAGIEVMTYEDLVDAAEKALALFRPDEHPVEQFVPGAG